MLAVRPVAGASEENKKADEKIGKSLKNLPQTTAAERRQ